MRVAVDLDPGLVGEGEQVACVGAQRRAGEVLAAVLALGPGDGDDGSVRARALDDPRRHLSEQDRLLVDGEGAWAVERGPQEFWSDAVVVADEVRRRRPGRGDDGKHVRI